MFNHCNFACRKVGGLWFIRFWRVRMSFCLVKLPITQETDNGWNDTRHGGYLAR